MIEVRDLWKSFEHKQVLKGINLDIYEGETLVLLGPSGQGKTVFLKCLIGIIKPDRGQIIVDGVDITKLSKRRLYEQRKKFAFVFQYGALFDFLTIKENLALYLTMHTNMKKKEIEAKIKEALAVVGLEEAENLYPEELSGGMKKRAAIARAIIQDPKYILYDEPTAGLDKKNAQVVNELINSLRDRYRVTSVVVTHDIDCMQTVADRVALMRRGEIVFVGGKEEIKPSMLDFVYEIGGENGI